MNPEIINALLGLGRNPLSSQIAAPVQGKSSPLYRGSSDQTLINFLQNPNLPQHTKEGLMKEYLLRRQHGTWGVPGVTPVPSQLS